MKQGFAFIAMCLVVGCTANAPLPTPITRTISQQAAIERAVQAASIARPEITGALVKPENICAEAMRLGDANKRLGQDALGSDERAEMPMWFVTMDGLWGDAFPRPTEFPTPKPFRHYVVIIDGITGEVRRVAALY